MCHVQFQNKTFVKEHRIAVHYRKKIPKEHVIQMAIESKINEQLLNDEGIQHVIQYIDETKEYLCTFSDMHMEWLYLPSTHAKVIEFDIYLMKNGNLIDTIPEITNYSDWIAREYIPDSN